MNLLPATIRVSGSDVSAWIDDQELSITTGSCRQNAALRQRHSGSVVLGVRPEYLERVDAGGTGTRLAGRLQIGEELGNEVVTHMKVSTPARGVTAEILSDLAEARDDLTTGQENTSVLVSRLAPGELPDPGGRMEVLLPDHAPLWFFDPDGDALPADVPAGVGPSGP